MGASPGDEDRERRFVALYERHYPIVLAYLRRRAPEAVARDVTAETFLVAWRRLEDAEERGLPWLYRTAALTLNNARRGESRIDRLSGRLTGMSRATSIADGASEHAERDRILRALWTLSAADREVLTLVLWEDLDVRDAAKVLGVTPGTAAVRLHRARRRLRRLLAETDTDRPVMSADEIRAPERGVAP